MTPCDLLIIGAGMAGMAAGLFAAGKNRDVVLAGITSEIGFASGLIDLLGVHPVIDQHIVERPWEAIDELRRDEPQHPYARLATSEIRDALDTMLHFFETHGCPYDAQPSNNVGVPTPAGTIKPTYAVPHTMMHGTKALAQHKPCLLVGFNGLRGFSALQIAQSLDHRWPELRPVHISFPDMEGEIYVERIARAMDIPDHRQKVADLIRPHLSGIQAVGFPAVLGIYQSIGAMHDLEQALGVPVFEIPTMLPAVTGLRMQNVFLENLPGLGVRVLFQHRVLKAHRKAKGQWLIELRSDDVGHHTITARSVILCSGRFLGRGLHADRHAIRETIFDLPVHQPSERALWHERDFFHPSGHAVNRAGVAVDGDFRPVDGSGKPLYDNLFAAGTILAHQDWMRQKCGCGLSIATAYGAVNRCLGFLK